MAFQPREQGRHTTELELFAGKVAIVIVFAIVLALLWAARAVLILVFFAAVIAAGIAPAVWRVRVLGRFWFKRRLDRGTAVLLVYFPFVILVAGLAIILAPRLIHETRALSAQLPLLVEQNILAPLDRFFPMDPVRRYLAKGISIPQSSVLLYLRSAATVIASVVAVLFMIVYMLIDAERLRNLILLLYPQEVRGDRRQTLTRMGNRMSSWLSAQLILSGIMGLASFAGLIALRVPYALPLAILAALGELVPVIGPIVGTTPALVIALLQSRWQFWSVLAMALVFQKMENFFIAPRVMAKKVSISPLAAFIAFMMGGAILGIIGAIMAIPVAAILKVAFEEVFVARRERRQDEVRAGTLVRRRD